MNEKYAKIANLPRPNSNYPRMSSMARAAQFSPFAALSGHEEAINETARLTEKYVELTNEEKLIINSKLNYIEAHLNENLIFNFIYFVPDFSKDGGHYLSKIGQVKRIDEFEDKIILKDKTNIKISFLKDIQSDVFN